MGKRFYSFLLSYLVFIYSYGVVQVERERFILFFVQIPGEKLHKTDCISSQVQVERTDGQAKQIFCVVVWLCYFRLLVQREGRISKDICLYFKSSK